MENTQAVTTQVAGKRIGTRTLTMIAMLTAVSYALSFIQIPLPLSPSFAKFDLADLPALIGSFAFGPLAGVMVELIKNLLGLIKTGTGGIGELANFLINGSFVATAGLIYKFNKNKKSALIGCAIGSVVRGIVAAFANYFILLPLFESFMPMEQIIEAFKVFLPFINTKFDVVMYNALPMNILQGLLISVITLMVYKKLSGFLKKQEW